MRLLLATVTGLVLLNTAAYSASYEEQREGAMSPELRSWSDASIALYRAHETTLRLSDSTGAPLVAADVDIRQTQQSFCFGSAFNEWVIDGNPDFKPGDPAKFKEWFSETFNCGTPASTLHWKLMESSPGEDGVGVWHADEAIQWMFDQDMQMLGHAVSWENPELVPDWVKSAPDAEALKSLFQGRIDRLVGRYKPWISHWVGINEMLDYDSISQQFDKGDFKFRPWLYKELKAYDPTLKLMVNEAHILAEPGRVEEYKSLIKRLIADGAEIDIIGIQAHFWPKDQEFINFETVKQRLDSLAELGLPIWITEFDYAHESETVRANQLEGFYRLAYAHPAVQAIKSWGFWEGAHWRADWGTPVALVDRDWRVAESGKRLQALMQEWKSQTSGRSDSRGHFSFSAHHGDYQMQIRSADGKTHSATFSVSPDSIAIDIQAK